MSRKTLQLPWVLLALDLLGSLLIVLGVLALTGTDFGQPVLETVAPGLIAIGCVLIAPLAVWAVRRSRQARPE